MRFALNIKNPPAKNKNSDGIIIARTELNLSPNSSIGPPNINQVKPKNTNNPPPTFIK